MTPEQLTVLKAAILTETDVVRAMAAGLTRQ